MLQHVALRLRHLVDPRRIGDLPYPRRVCAHSPLKCHTLVYYARRVGTGLIRTRRVARAEFVYEGAPVVVWLNPGKRAVGCGLSHDDNVAGIGIDLLDVLVEAVALLQ